MKTGGLKKIDAMIEKFERVDLAVVHVLTKVTDENKHVIEDKNIAQLKAGKKANGDTMPPYSPTSVGIFGKPEGPIQLLDEGDFHRGITAELFNGGFKMIGTDPKTEMLQREYGEDIIGESKESLAELRSELYLPELKREIRFNYFTLKP
jgi:hypothetical protein